MSIIVFRSRRPGAAPSTGRRLLAGTAVAALAAGLVPALSSSATAATARDGRTEATALASWLAR